VGWSHLAEATGYYDQSHLTAEFRAMMGVPPTAFFAGRLPSLQPC
jgi:AraC-like DNA-binding protein